MAYNIETGLYNCDICGFEMPWDGNDEAHGPMWGCEKCETLFCSKCFQDKFGYKRYMNMLQDEDLVLCPECYERENAL